MTTGTTSTTAAGSAWALLTHRAVTWRQASEGSAVLAAAGIGALAAATVVTLGRRLIGSRG